MVTMAIIDDEISVFQIIKKIIDLEKLPIEITAYYSDGKQAMEALKLYSFDIIISDIRMPYYNGLEIIKAFPDNNYILVTAYDEFTYAQEALRLGAKDLLLKPIDRKKLLNTLDRLLIPYKRENPKIDSIVNMIHQRFDQSNISVEQLAEDNFMKSSNLCRLFKKHMNDTIMSYITKLRMNKAKELLVETDKSISEISNAVGFVSDTAFYRTFKSQTNMTPNEFRQKSWEIKNTI